MSGHPGYKHVGLETIAAVTVRSHCDMLTVFPANVIMSRFISFPLQLGVCASGSRSPSHPAPRRPCPLAAAVCLWVLEAVSVWFRLLTHCLVCLAGSAWKRDHTVFVFCVWLTSLSPMPAGPSHVGTYDSNHAGHLKRM